MSESFRARRLSQEEGAVACRHGGCGAVAVWVNDELDHVGVHAGVDQRLGRAWPHRDRGNPFTQVLGAGGGIRPRARASRVGRYQRVGR